MPDQTPNPAPASPATPSTPADVTTPSPQRGPTINIADEFGTAQRNLPPVKPLVLTTVGILIIVGAVEIPSQNASLVALTFTLRNSGEKSLWVHDIQGKLLTSSGELTSEAV